MSNVQTLSQYADSDSVYNLIVGEWYLQQENIVRNRDDCNTKCYCNHQYTFNFSRNWTLVRNSADGIDTLSYGFFPEQDSLQNVYTTGWIKKEGDSTISYEIFYTSNYICVEPPFDLSDSNTNGAFSYPQSAYFLTRN